MLVLDARGANFYLNGSSEQKYETPYHVKLGKLTMMVDHVLTLKPRQLRVVEQAGGRSGIPKGKTKRTSIMKMKYYP